jgi:hypothetical protein
MKTCTAVTSRTPPGSRGHSCSPPVRLSQLLGRIKFSKHNKFPSFIPSSLFVILSAIICNFGNFRTFRKSRFLDHAAKRISQSILFHSWPDTSLPGILLLNFEHFDKTSKVAAFIEK